jgi:hypothetical protein
MKTHFKAWIGIVVFSWMAAIPIAPSDPMTILTVMAMMLIVAGLAYWLGMRNVAKP